MTDTVEIRIPFSGFYCSTHDAMLDDALENLFRDDFGDTNDAEFDAAQSRINWHRVFIRYAEAYAEALGDDCNLTGLTFNRLVSPREYNFATDEIVCNIPADRLATIYADCDKLALAALVSERLRQRDGFIPFYSDDLSEWGDFAEWEAPQIDLMIEAYCNEHCDAEWRDCYAMESYSGNGYFDLWFTEAGAFEGELAA